MGNDETSNNKTGTQTIMITKILLGLASVIIVFGIVAATRPADFRVERNAALSASPAALFEHVNDHHKFAVWNPFLKLDPNVKNTYSGPASGVGAVCSWEGNKDVGAGSCTIIESKPGELVRCRMDWKRPMGGTSTVDFTFKPEGGKTVVTWAMYGKNNFKVMSLFMDCDQWPRVLRPDAGQDPARGGGEIARGLATLSRHGNEAHAGFSLLRLSAHRLRGARSRNV